MLQDLARAALEPYAEEASLELDGQTVQVGVSQITPLALILHEWATNASKYSVLGPVGGKLSLTWELNGDEDVLVRWVETGAKQSTDDGAATGFGSRLVKMSVQQLQGELDIDLEDETRRMLLRFPVSKLGASQ